MTSDPFDIRPGEITTSLPEHFDAGVYFIGRIRTPWTDRKDCPHAGDRESGPVCTLEINERWQLGLTGLEGRTSSVQVLYWMDRARRDLLIQAPRHSGAILGTFALRSPVRPNPIASSLVTLVGVEANKVYVRGLDCLDGTPLVDLKPEQRQGDTK